MARLAEQRTCARCLLVGIEAHVCMQQTALDLLAAGYRVYLAVDAIGSRYDIDYQTALRRMDSAGATLTTTEAALFEWCERSGTPAVQADQCAWCRKSHRLKLDACRSCLDAGRHGSTVATIQ